MKKRILLTSTILGSLALVSGNECLAMSSPQAHEQSTHPFSEFVQEFRTAFHEGDVKTLNRLKKTTPDFYNIDDLGEGFSHYGPGMRNWDQLILDARKEAKEWPQIVKKFRTAFHEGDVKTLNRIKKTTPFFYNIDDLGEGFSLYGPGMRNWDKLISDARENGQNAREKAKDNKGWPRMLKKFRTAFHEGDVKTLNHIRETTPGFYNINDLGGEFFHYGPGMRNWDKLISDARKNSNLDNLEGASQIFS